jgi:hypothetical protein
VYGAVHTPARVWAGQQRRPVCTSFSLFFFSVVFYLFFFFSLVVFVY